MKTDHTPFGSSKANVFLDSNRSV